MFLLALLHISVKSQIVPVSFNPDLAYTLTKYKPLSYASLEQCIKAETIKQNASAFDYYNKVIDNNEVFSNRLKDDYLDELADKSNKLTKDDLASIFLYTATSIFCKQFIQQTRTGKIGHYNCYMDFLIAAMNKLKEPEQIVLYRGTGLYGSQIVQSFHKGQKILLDSYTSTSKSFSAAKETITKNIDFPTDDIVGAIIIIEKIGKNSRDIKMISDVTNEEEYLYPPMTKFMALSDPYIMYCTLNARHLSDCDREEPNKKINAESKRWKMVFINVSEIDEKVEYIEEENPYPTPIPQPTATPTPKPNNRRCISSCDDDKSESSAKILGNFMIQNTFIGASTVVDFDVGYNIMNKMRKTIGHAIPAPNFLHPAIWVSSGHANNDTVGAVFVYGKYYPDENDHSFISNDGAKSYSMTLGQFKEKFDAFEVIHAIPKRKLKLFDFMREIKSSGKWNAANYRWTTNNCQHFVTKCLDILQAVRYLPNENDWIHLPFKILKTLKFNEKRNK